MTSPATERATRPSCTRAPQLHEAAEAEELHDLIDADGIQVENGPQAPA